MEKITLAYPIEDEGKQISTLELRRARVADLEVMERESGNMAKSIVLLSQLSGLSTDAIRQLDAADFDAASEQVAGFLA